MCNGICNTFYIYIPRWVLLQSANTEESTYYLLHFQNIFSSSIHPLLFKSKTIHTFCRFLLLIIVFKAITLPLKDPNVLIMLRILTVILQPFSYRSTLEIYTTDRDCWARNFILSQRTYMFHEIVVCLNNMTRS